MNTEILMLQNQAVILRALMSLMDGHNNVIYKDLKEQLMMTEIAIKILVK